MGRKKRKIQNHATQYDYEVELRNMFMTVFKWHDVPDTINLRYLARILLDEGKAVFFRDEVLGHLALKFNVRGSRNVYGEYRYVTAIADTGYRKNLIVGKNCVIIWANYEGVGMSEKLCDYARRFDRIDKTIDLNVEGQKTPYVVEVQQDQKLSVEKFFQQVDDFEYRVFLREGANLDVGIKVTPTVTPFVADQLHDLRKRMYNDVLSFIGVDNNSDAKKERLTPDEALLGNGLANAQRNAKLQALEESIEKANKMFGLNMSVEISNEILTDIYRADTIGGDE